MVHVTKGNMVEFIVKIHINEIRGKFILKIREIISSIQSGPIVLSGESFWALFSIESWSFWFGCCDIQVVTLKL